MRRILIVYNPRSSRHAEVKAAVLEPANHLAGFMVGKYEVAKIGIENNVQRLAKLVMDGDLVIAAGGDATGVITMNAVMRSQKKATVAVLPYGNFNDLSRTLGVTTLDEAVAAEKCKFYPLGIYVDDQFWRWASCYVTIGMTAEAVKLYDAPKMRQKLQSSSPCERKMMSYWGLIGWYFRNRHAKQFLPACALNGRAQDPRVSDYAAVNGRYMARVMKGREDFLSPQHFRSVVDRLGSFWRLFSLMFRSITDRVPGNDTTGDTLIFLRPATIEIQAEGESKVFKQIRKIEIKKSDQYFWAKRQTKD